MNKKKIFNIHPSFISGFTNSDASFILSLNRVNHMKLKFRVIPLLVFTQHSNDRFLLDEINQYFHNSGHIVKDHRNNCYYLRFNSLPKIIKYIIPHFSNPLYSLKGQKRIDFIIWKHVIDLIIKKEHLHILGLINIIELSLKMYHVNHGKKKRHFLDNLYSEFNLPKSNFDPLEPISHLFLEEECLLDPWFLTGIVQGDGSPLGIVFKKNGQISQYFAIGLEINSINILKEIKSYFQDVGHIHKIKDNYYRFVIYSKSDILNYVVPHFEEYPLRGYRLSQYLTTLEYFKNPSDALKEKIYNISFNGKRRRNKG